MTSSATLPPLRATQGVVLMTFAMLSFPLCDGLAKYLSLDYSPLFISWARYAVACLVVLPVAVAIHGARVFPAEQRVFHLLRTVFLVTAMTLYFLAVAEIQLATAISAFFVAPIIAMALSIVVLRERMTWRKGLSLAMGFAGSLIILQPGGTLQPGILLALGAGLFFAVYMIATRQASQASDPIKTLAFQCVVGMVLLSPQAVATWSLPAQGDLLFFAGLGLFSAISHFLSIAAFRFADASTLSPLVYLELVGSAVIGFVAFAEVPGPATLMGAAIIVTAGLILLQRRRAAF
jgi:drug/metabolite transporter (DMT)-like permease